MRARLYAVCLPALVLAVVGCSAPGPTTTATATPTSVTSHAPSPAATSVAVASEPPVECVEYVSEQFPHAPGGEAVAAAAARAVLPPTVILNPGVQTLASVDEPGMIEVVARVCTTPLSETALVDIANEIAIAVKSDPASEAVSVLVVSAWEPGSGEYLEQGESVTTDFQSYTWDPAAAAPMSSNWK